MTHGNAMITVMDYDLQGRMLDKTLLAKDASTVVDERFYEYDADNNITARTGTPGDHSYSYDAVDRLIEQDITGAENIQYRYDLNGNRLERTIDTGSDIIADLLSYQPDSNRLTEVISTELPNRATQSQQSWIYNQANRMAAYLQDGAITTEYIVNSQGQRSHKTDALSGTQTIYHYSLAGYQILTETTTDASNITGKDYIWLNGEPVAQIDSSNGTDTISYLHTDHLLTPRLATDATGLTIWRWEGEVFGDVQPQELAVIEINLRFPGQYYDAESGLHYNMFRDYNTETGRYVQSDPIGLDGATNGYEYSVSNPISYLDLTGEQANTDIGMTNLNRRMGGLGNMIGDFLCGSMNRNIRIQYESFKHSVELEKLRLEECEKKCYQAVLEITSFQTRKCATSFSGRIGDCPNPDIASGINPFRFFIIEEGEMTGEYMSCCSEFN